MNTGKYVFSQILARVPHWQFQRLVRRHAAESSRLEFSAWEHFAAMMFAQLTYRESLRDIEACLGSQPQAGYHLGFRRPVRRSTLAYANEHRDWRLYAELAQQLMTKARKLYQDEPTGLEMEADIYALDATMIDLSMALCPWANWNRNDAAVKMHTLLDLRGPLPSLVSITQGNLNEMAWLDELPLEAGGFYLMDRGYLDLRRLQRFTREGAFFVIRERPDLHYYIRQSRPVDRSGIIRADQTIHFNGPDSRRNWPGPMRRVTIFDPERKRHFAFWTNQWMLPPAVIAELYRNRWRIEIYFRWIKQNLRIRHFYGSSPNAVRLQLWIAICTYLAVAITRKQLSLVQSLSTVLQIISVNAFQKTPLPELFASTHLCANNDNFDNQLPLNYY